MQSQVEGPAKKRYRKSKNKRPDLVPSTLQLRLKVLTTRQTAKMACRPYEGYPITSHSFPRDCSPADFQSAIRNLYPILNGVQFSYLKGDRSNHLQALNPSLQTPVDFIRHGNLKRSALYILPEKVCIYFTHNAHLSKSPKI